MIRCPWPPRELWPNGRPNRFAKARATKSYRSACHWLAKEQSVHLVNWPEGDIEVSLTFHPKTARLPDDDNAEAAFKSGRDGIAEAMGVNDANWRVSRSFGDPVKGGCVMVRIITQGTRDVPVIGVIS